MLGIDQRALKITWTVFLFALILGFLYQARHTLVIFALALFLAHLLGPVVGFFDRITPKKIPRIAILGLVYVAMLALTIIAVVSVGSRIGIEAASLAARLPSLVHDLDLTSTMRLPVTLEFARPEITGIVKERLHDLEQHVLPVLSSAGLQIISGIGSMLSAILIPILSFFFLKDGPAIGKAIVEGFDRPRQAVVNDILSDLHLLLAQYIRALVLLALSTFTFYSAFLSIAGVPYAILLAGIAMFLEFIPVVGPLTASAVILLVSAFTGYPHLLWILIFLVVYRIFQDYVLSPYLMSAGVELHPLLILFGVLAGEQIAGVPGMFFSVPVMAALRVVFVRLRRKRLAGE
jgi:predicted PurR-regulated permease PerM